VQATGWTGAAYDSDDQLTGVAESDATGLFSPEF